MDCNSFIKWLENRDLSDISESDRAMRHARECPACKESAAKDTLLDQTIARGLAEESLPEHLERIVAMNLTGGVSRRRRISTPVIRFASLCAGVAALLLVYVLMPTDTFDNPAGKEYSLALARDHRDATLAHPTEQTSDIPGWIAEHVGFRAEPPVEFAAAELRFVGLRICVVNECRTVHLLYRDGEDLVSLFIISAQEAPASFTQGKIYKFAALAGSIRIWRDQSLVFAVVT